MSPQDLFFSCLEDLIRRVGQLSYYKPQPIPVVLKATNFSKRRNECFPGLAAKLPSRLLSHSDFDQILFVLETATLHNERGTRVIIADELSALSKLYESYRIYYNNEKKRYGVHGENIYPNVAINKIKKLADRYKYTDFSILNPESLSAIIDLISDDLNHTSDFKESISLIISLYKILNGKNNINIDKYTIESCTYSLIWNGHLYSNLSNNKEAENYFYKLAKDYDSRYASVESRYLVRYFDIENLPGSSHIPDAMALPSWRNFGWPLKYLKARAYYKYVQDHPLSVSDGIDSNIYRGNNVKEFIYAMNNTIVDEGASQYISAVTRITNAGILAANGLFTESVDQMIESNDLFVKAPFNWFEIVLFHRTVGYILYNMGKASGWNDLDERLGDVKSKILNVMLDNKVDSKMILKLLVRYDYSYLTNHLYVRFAEALRLVIPDG